MLHPSPTKINTARRASRTSPPQSLPPLPSRSAGLTPKKCKSREQKLSSALTELSHYDIR